MGAAVNDRWRAFSPFEVSPQRIKNVVAHMYDFDVEDLDSPSRKQPLARRRQIACWLMRDMLGLSYPQIAAAVNRQDHATAIYSVQRIETMLDEDPQLAAEVRILRDLVAGQRRAAA